MADTAATPAKKTKRQVLEGILDRLQAYVGDKALPAPLDAATLAELRKTHGVDGLVALLQKQFAQAQERGCLRDYVLLEVSRARMLALTRGCAAAAAYTPTDEDVDMLTASIGRALVLVR